MKKYILSFLLAVAALGSSAQPYPKLIFPGDYPDPSIMRDGGDYYMTHSPFYYAPGFLIWHSRDLVNWEPVCRVLPEYLGSAMAPDLLKYDNRFYIYYPANGTNWVIWADRIEGPWSAPVDLKVGGIDPGHIADRDGKRYLYLSDGYAVPLTDDGLATAGRRQKVYEGWRYPEQWETECMCLESPKLNYKDGYFYMTSAEGGTAGPATSHMVVAARSRSVMGPWENSPYNPIVHTYSPDEAWWSKGHGTLIDDVNGNWWIVYHAYAKGFHTLGRQPLIEPVEWTPDGWYRTIPSAALPVDKKSAAVKGLELSDDFKGPGLGLQWTFWKEYSPESALLKKGSLYLKGKGTTPADGRKLLATVTDTSYETSVDITVGAGGLAGLILFYNEKAYAGIVSDGKQFTVYEHAGQKKDLPNGFGNHFFLKIVNRENKCDMLASKDNRTWVTLAANVDVSELHHNNYGGFYALRIGLFSAGEGEAQFRQFRYGKIR